MTDYMMLWFENSAEPAEAKIQRAKLYYRDKYGQMPNFAELHPDQLPQSEVPGVQVISSKYMIRNNMLIGVADVQEAP